LLLEEEEEEDPPPSLMEQPAATLVKLPLGEEAWPLMIAVYFVTTSSPCLAFAFPALPLIGLDFLQSLLYQKV
jgi:hypothetical protein